MSLRASSDGPPSWDQLDSVLSGARRRQVLERLGRDGGEATVSRLTTAVACREFDTGPGALSSRDRRAVAFDLRRRHLPRLDGAGLVAWDRETDRVTLTDYAGSLPLFGPDGRVREV